MHTNTATHLLSLKQLLGVSSVPLLCGTDTRRPPDTRPPHPASSPSRSPSRALTCLEVGGVVPIQGQGGGDDGGMRGGAPVDTTQHPPIVHVQRGITVNHRRLKIVCKEDRKEGLCHVHQLQTIESNARRQNRGCYTVGKDN